jgi:hypothetical protein
MLTYANVTHHSTTTTYRISHSKPKHPSSTLNTHTHTHTHTYIYIYTHAHTHARTAIHTHTHFSRHTANLASSNQTYLVRQMFVQNLAGTPENETLRESLEFICPGLGNFDLCL